MIHKSATSADGLSRMLYSFDALFPTNMAGLTRVMLASAATQTRKTRRHGWQTDALYERIQRSRLFHVDRMAAPVVPPEIVAEVLAEVRANVTFIAHET